MLLDVLLPSLAAQTYRDFRVVVVDDCSVDDTVAWLELEWPEVQVVAMKVNGGVTKALNACVHAGWDSPFIAMFNNDIELEPDCLRRLVDDLRAHPTAGSAGAKLLNYHRRNELDGAGDVFDWGGTATRRGNGTIDTGRYETSQDIFGACAGAALYRRAAFERVGLFDEQFQAFFEDVDWSFRAQLAGLTARYVPAAIGYHVGSATIGPGLTDFTRYQLIRNGIWIVAKDFPAGALVRHAPRIIYIQAAQLALAARDGKTAIWSRAVRDAVRGLPAVVSDRRAVQRSRTISLRDLEFVVAQR